MNKFQHLPKFDAEKFIPKDDSSEHPEQQDHTHHASRPFDAHLKTAKLEQSLTFRQNIEFMKRLEEEKRISFLKKLFHSGDIEAIIQFLETDSKDDFFFHKEIHRVQKTYEHHLRDTKFLTPGDWKILTALEIFDKETFEHSVSTYLIVRQKIEKRVREFGEEIIDEGVELEQLYRGCLFHDIGKMAIPKFLLNNNITQQEWIFHFMDLSQEQQDEILVEHKIIIPDSIRKSHDKMLDFFENNRIRAVRLVPIGKVLSEEQLAQLKKLDPHIRLTNTKELSHASLIDIMRVHEKKSEEILKKLGYGIEALIAGNHHNCKHKDEMLGQKPISFSVAHLSIETASSIIHLADVHQAMSGGRAYNSKHPTLRILAFLADDAEKGLIDLKTTARWIFDELKKMSPAYLFEIRNLLAKRQHHKYLLERQLELARIEDFLCDYLPESEENVQSSIAA